MREALCTQNSQTLKRFGGEGLKTLENLFLFVNFSDVSDNQLTIDRFRFH